MAPRRMEIALSAFLAVTLSLLALVQSDCSNALIGMASCLDYISPGSSASSAPSADCCTGLSGVVKSQPRCLCEIINGGGSSLGLDINKTQALALPKACNVHTPSVSLCNMNSSEGPPSGPSPPGTPHSSGSAAGGESQGSSTMLLHFLLFTLPAIAIYLCIVY